MFVVLAGWQAHPKWSSKSLDVQNHRSGPRTIASRPGWPRWAVPSSRWCFGRLGWGAGLAIPHDTTSFTSMGFTAAWVTRVGRAVVSVVFVCRLGRVARLASPHDTARFTSMVFTLGVMALLDLFGRGFTPPPPGKHGRKHQTRIPLCWFGKIETTILRPSQKACAFRMPS